MTYTDMPATSRRIALGIEYDGSAFNGWQTQLDPHLATVQETLEAALSKVADHRITVLCAGRTDAGVHATGQVVHFETTAQRPDRAWVHGVNSNLPPTVAVQWSQTVDDDFHARFSAYSRRYRYLIANSKVRPALYHRFLTHVPHRLDEEMMHQAGQLLLGENDFSSFRAAGCQSRTAMRNVSEVAVYRRDELLCVEIEANAFLLHMVRNIVGTLLQIGKGEKPATWAGELLRLKDRTLAAPTAPAHGLCLIAVRYPQHFALPTPAAKSLF